MRFDILTLFPAMFSEVFNTSILKHAQQKGALEVHLHNFRDVAKDTHKTVDDTPYGGGAGMVLKVDILDEALQAVQQKVTTPNRRSILLCPQGKRLTQAEAKRLAQYEQITLICGHYEGFDERIRSLVDEELSIGDFVLTGGELPAMVVVDCLTRLQPEVLHEDTPDEESFSITDEAGNPLIEYPHYTRPVEYKEVRVPDVLLSGNHAEIKKWRLEQAKERTRRLNAD
jgi:tRNA (guanine37-N1)-methyltransferase